MEIEMLSQHWSAIICICVIIGTFIIGYYKKWMVSHIIILSNIIVFFLTFIYYKEIVYGFSYGLPYAGLGFRASFLSLEQTPQIYTILTSMFIHGGFAHIFGNMFIFFFIGVPFEERIGWKNFFIIYILSGICGTIVHSLLNLGSSTPLVGASGAIFGIMGAFAYSYPRDKVLLPIGIGFAFLMKVRVIIAVTFYALIETAIIWWESQTGMVSSTAHFAHFGGLIGGVVLAAILIRNKTTHTKEGKTIYYDSFSAQRPDKINISSLKKLATTPELKEILHKIESETIKHARDIWLEHFIEKATCPKCSKSLHHIDGKIQCIDCGYKTSY